MKITKLMHSCLLVEMTEPVNRTVLFDPGVFSEPFVDVASLVWLDDIVVTHMHFDHMSVPLIKKLVDKFPKVRITAPEDAIQHLSEAGIRVSTDTPEGIELFESPHESIYPLSSTPEQIGVHYLGLLTHPGDSHTFSQTKSVLALPVQAPWGSTIRAINLALELKPKYIVPIHDWHWSEEARVQMYSMMEKVFKEEGITFLSVNNGEPIVLRL